MSSTVIIPYLTFSGRCEEAIDFYRTAVGAEVEIMMLFKDSPDPPPPGMLQQGFEDKVMHATLRIGEARLMAVAVECRRNCLLGLSFCRCPNPSSRIGGVRRTCCGRDSTAKPFRSCQPGFPAISRRIGIRRRE